MGLVIRALAALTACTLVGAYPQQTAPPNGTSPATSPGITPAPSCEADCTYRPPYFYAVTWTTNYITENITYATVVTIINTVRNTTRYVTSTIDLPDNYTLPATNDAGTVVCPVPYDGTTTLLPLLMQPSRLGSRSDHGNSSFPHYFIRVV
ncbi:hypothetical protein SLS58_006025 [Diplodia intermedia]|uniref:Uncharacterized protein n=1 Tax=Diplodia intermedia TaxID=856260 RepID=A0ABR3TPD5_9PEZI